MAREFVPLPDLTDEDIMPSGKHKGDKMIDVPAQYLIYVYENDMVGERVKKYIESNLDVLRQQVKSAK